MPGDLVTWRLSTTNGCSGHLASGSANGDPVLRTARVIHGMAPGADSMAVIAPGMAGHRLANQAETPLRLFSSIVWGVVVSINACSNPELKLRYTT